jgi:outer membrane autotransporter protein
MRRSLVVSLALVALVNAPAVAQTCMGMASFSKAPVQVAGNSQFVTGLKTFGGSLGYGMKSGLWGKAEVGTQSYDQVDSHPMSFGARAGYQIPVARGKAQVCPTASFTVANGPDAANQNQSIQDGTLGLSIGTVMGSNPKMKIVPTAGLSYAHDRLSSKDSLGTSLPANGATQSYGLASLGLGLVLNDNISVRPSVEIPLGLDGNTDARFGLSLGYNFGSSRPAGRRH